MELGYNEYREFVGSIVSKERLDSFKRNNIYNGILEHVSREQGQLYYDLSKKEFQVTDEDILSFTTFNDSFGEPVKETYSFGSVSPSSLRYVYHSHLILKYLQFLGKKNYSIVEIGGGYGGLALALSIYANKFDITINEYNICDLDVVIKLQEMYIKQACKDTNIYKFHDASTYGTTIESENLFLISCYAFSEINMIHQKRYLNFLFPKITSGFIIWNTNYYDFGRKTYIQEERPQTHPDKINKFVFF